MTPTPGLDDAGLGLSSRLRGGPTLARYGPLRSGGSGALGPRPTGLTHGVGEGEQVILGERRLGVFTAEADDLPPAGGGESLCVGEAQVIAVRLCVGRERTDDNGPVPVGIGERGDGRTGTSRLRASTCQAHEG